tara:strand:- start:4649 stop:5704 length:1056 start_codon:yes stop_codon:yes gene_type:complete
MAFLDNSGDIILDAVLTDVGRRRLAQATVEGGSMARISAFCLGDDEINYTQYDLNHPSGSNYSDLEILQTPILQAFTSRNANINYGLLKIRNTDILYLPALNVNTLKSANFNALQKKSNIFYFAVNVTTYNSLIDNESLTSNQVGYGYNGTAPPYIFVEGGLDTPLLTKDASNKASYITSMGVSNRTYAIGADRRLASTVYTSNGIGTFSNDKTTGTDNRGGFAVTPGQRMGNYSQAVQNYDYFSSAGIQDNVVEPDQNGPSTNISAIKGPGDTVTCFKLNVKSSLRTDGVNGGLRDILYSQIGSINVGNNTLFGTVAARTYDYIDTFVYINGSTTGATISLPLRIIRRVT